MTDEPRQEKFFAVYSMEDGGVGIAHDSIEEACKSAERFAAQQPGTRFCVMEAVWCCEVAEPRVVQVPVVWTNPLGTGFWTAPAEPVPLNWEYGDSVSQWTAPSRRYMTPSGHPFRWVIEHMDDWHYRVLDIPGSLDIGVALVFKRQADAKAYCQNIEDSTVGPAYRKGE